MADKAGVAYEVLSPLGGATPGEKEIQKVDLPENWDKLVAKYKNVVLTFARY